MLHLEQAKKILQDKSVRTTEFRLSVLSVFIQHPQAINMQTITDSLGKFDRISLYRTMKTFEEMGIIHPIPVDAESTFYALCEEDCTMADKHQHDHMHFQCLTCNEVQCLPSPIPNALEMKGFQVQSVEILAKGICNRCS